MSRTLALDVGERRVGVAVSDPAGIVAQPLLVIERRGWAADLARLRTLVAEYRVSRIVVGYPLTLANRRGAQTRRVDQFVERLRAALPVAVETWDERLTTAAAERILLGGDASRARRRAVRDAVAAAVLLQGYLDRERGRAPSPPADSL
jgi:putative Holliday junction resolvase